jgi:outer membrane protein OmpA-like peptidoglycan-associated protein
LAAAANETNRVQRISDAQAANAQDTANRLKQENDNKLAAAQADADRARRDNAVQIASANNEVNRLKAENDAKLAATQNDAARMARESAAKTAAAEAETARVKRESDAKTAAASAEADRLRAENDSQRANAQAAIERIAQEKKQLENERAALRVLLLQQFNAILQTRDTARGLIVNMSDVTFATGKYALLPGAQLKLAKVAGIVSGHPGLHLDVEGHTDSVGNDDANQKLSEERGGSVRDFLVKQGMSISSVTSKGFGESAPVATNDTAAGRQLNRRVELVISGDIIGQSITIPVAIR